MIDITQKVITQYQADTSDHVAELKKLKGAISDTQKAELDAAEKRNEVYDSWLESLANVNQALELGSKAIAFAKDAFKAYADDLKMRAAAGTVNIEKLAHASMGLRTEHELLTFAAQTQNGVIKANEEQMATAQRAMIALTRAGFDQEEVTKKVTEAMISLKVNGLDDLGITVKKGKTDLETYNNLMSELGKRAVGVKDGTTTASEGIQQMGVSMHDSFEKVKISIGELVAAMAPLLNALARAVSLIAEAAGGVLSSVPNPDEMKKLMAKRQAVLDAINGGGSTADMVARYQASQGKAAAVATGGGPTVGIEIGEIVVTPQRSGGGKARRLDLSELISVGGIDRVGPQMGFDSTFYESQLGGLGRGMTGAGIQVPEYAEETQAVLDGLRKIDEEAANSKWFAELRANRERGESLLTKAFGTSEEFDFYGQLFTNLGGVFQGFSNAVAGGYEAIVTGQGSASAAFKKIFADAVLAMGKSSVVEALKETAHGIGSLAMYNYPKAALHFKSAAAHAAVAVAAGVAANALGAGSSSGSGGSGAAPSAGAGSPGASGGGATSRPSSGAIETETARPIVMIVGSSFDDMSPRQRRSAAEDTMRRAMRERDE